MNSSANTAPTSLWLRIALVHPAIVSVAYVAVLIVVFQAIGTDPIGDYFPDGAFIAVSISYAAHSSWCYAATRIAKTSKGADRAQDAPIATIAIVVALACHAITIGGTLVHPGVGDSRSLFGLAWMLAVLCWILLYWILIILAARNISRDFKDQGLNTAKSNYVALGVIFLPIGIWFLRPHLRNLVPLRIEERF